MNNEIQPEEKLYRYVKSTIPNQWDDQENRPSSALFKDSKGVSVDRDGERSEQVIIDSFKQRLGNDNLRAVVYVDAGTCYEIPTHLKYVPDDNPYHAEIHDSPTNAELSRSKARKLAKACKVAYTR